jgi:hypothetical protein
MSIFLYLTLLLQSDVIKVNGPTKIDSGSLVELDASITEADDFIWVCPNKNVDFKTANNGKTLYFATPVSGNYDFVLSVSKENKVYSKVWSVKVGEGSPTPEPEVKIPDSKHGLTKQTYLLAKKVPVEYQKFLQPIASNYLSLAARITAEEIKDVDDLKNKTFSGNRRAMGLEEEGEVTDKKTREDMVSVFFAPLAEVVSACNLETLEDHKEAWTEIGVGLEKLNAIRSP